MCNVFKTYGGVIFFYSIVIVGVVLLFMKNNNTTYINDNTNTQDYNISIAYNG